MTEKSLAYIDEICRTIKEYLIKKCDDPDTVQINLCMWWTKGEAPCIEVHAKQEGKIEIEI